MSVDALDQAHALLNNAETTGFVILAFQKYAPPILYCLGVDECPVSVDVDIEDMIAGETIRLTITKHK